MSFFAGYASDGQSSEALVSPGQHRSVWLTYDRQICSALLFILAMDCAMDLQRMCRLCALVTMAVPMPLTSAGKDGSDQQLAQLCATLANSGQPVRNPFLYYSYFY